MLPEVEQDLVQRRVADRQWRGEKGVDVVVSRRFKGKRGMKWGRARAEGVLALRVAELNDEWTQRLTAALGLSTQLPAF